MRPPFDAVHRYTMVGLAVEPLPFSTIEVAWQVSCPPGSMSAEGAIVFSEMITCAEAEHCELYWCMGRPCTMDDPSSCIDPACGGVSRSLQQRKPASYP